MRFLEHGDLSFVVTSSRELLSAFDDDFDLFSEVAKVFLKDYEIQLLRIEAALLQRDNEALAKAAHALKGAASNFVKKEVVEPASTIESLAVAKKIGEVEPILECLKADLVTLVAQLEQLLADREVK